MNIGIDIDNTITEVQEELKYFLKNIQEEITNMAKPRFNAVEAINRLRKEGHKIIIITARDSEFHDNPYLLVKIG